MALTTAPSDYVAKSVTSAVLQAKLAACVNAVSAVRSSYWWEGKIVTDQEVLLIMKTQRPLVAALNAAIKTVHPYDVPEFIVLPIVDGSPDYLKWIGDSTRDI